LSHEQPFVGRESEQRQLSTAYEAVARSGDGRLIMLVGEPGIGKTAVCEQLSSRIWRTMPSDFPTEEAARTAYPPGFYCRVIVE
jgi:predicted ATPase